MKLLLNFLVVLFFCYSCSSPTDMEQQSEADTQILMDSLKSNDTLSYKLTEKSPNNAPNKSPKQSPKQYRKEFSKKLEMNQLALTSEMTSEMGSNSIESPKRKGSMVYYCPSKMLENTCNNVSVTISTDEAQRAVEKLVQRVKESTGGDIDKIRSNTSNTSIDIYPKMKVELKYDEKDFATIYRPEKADLKFDGKSDMQWDWIIKPIRVGNTQLSLIVSAYDQKNGQWVSVDIPPKIFDIDVKIDPRNYFSKLWGFLESNPEWIFVQVIFPIIAYYVGRRRQRKKAS